MRNTIIFFGIILLFTSFKPGVKTGKLTAESSSGKTTFKAEFENMSIIRSAELAIDKLKIIFTSGDNCHIIFDPDNKVFTMYLESESGDETTELWAVPSTFQELPRGEVGPSGDVYKFNAKLRAMYPAKDGGNYETPVIDVVCTLSYGGR